MVKKPLVSIVIPYYNHGHYLPFCVKTIQDQGIEEIEIIIVNDASTDDSLKIAKNLASKDKRIKILNNKENIGCVKSTYRGDKFAKGKYIFNFSSTDGLLPGYLKKGIKILEENPNVGFVFSEISLINEKGERTRDVYFRKTKSYIGKDDYLDFITHGSFIHALLVRKEAFEKIGFQKQNIPLATEWDMQLQLVKNFKSAYINEPLTLFRVHEDSISENSASSKYLDIGKTKEETIWAIEEHLKTNPSKKIRKLLYASMNYRIGKIYFNQKDYFNALKHFVKSLRNPFCILARIKSKYQK